MLRQINSNKIIDLFRTDDPISLDDNIFLDKSNLLKSIESEITPPLHNNIKTYPLYDKTDIEVKTIPLIENKNNITEIESNTDEDIEVINSVEELIQESNSGSKYNYNVPEYTSIYTGILNDETIYGCNVIASHFKDKFNVKNRKFERIKYFTWDYLDEIQNMNKIGYTCIWLGETWALGVFRDTFNTYRYFEKSSQELNKQTNNSDVQFKQLTSLYIGEVNEDSIKVMTVPTPVGVMIFCKCDANEASEYYLKINREISMYDWDKYYSVYNFPLTLANDIIHLYPISYFIVDKYVVFFTSALYGYQLPPIVNYLEMRYQISKLDELDAKYASVLCMERLNYSHTIIYDKQQLKISDTGFIQAEEIKQVFLECLTYISKNGIRYNKVNLPIGISFTHNGYWYTTSKNIKNNDKYISPTDSKISYYGLRSKNPDEKYDKSDLPPLEIIIDEVENNLYATYKYNDIYILTKKIDKNNNDIKFNKTIYKNYLKGLYFNQATKNILRNYPKYILSREAVIPI